MRPNLLIAGGTRCATTFLHNNLIQHPGISGSAQKEETHFLAYGAGVEFHGPDDVTTINRNLLRHAHQWDEMYLNVENTYVLESSTSTLYGGEAAIDRINTHCEPDVKIIVILRDPVKRMISAHQYLSNRGSETLGLMDAVAAERSRMRDNWHHLWHYAAMGRYGEQLLPFIKAFGSRLCILDYDQLTLHPVETITAVCEWLNLGAACPVSTRPVNQSGVARSNTALKMVQGLKHGSITYAVYDRLPLGLRQWVKNLLFARKPETPEVGSRFKSMYETDIQLLKGLLRRADWPMWLREW